MIYNVVCVHCVYYVCVCVYAYMSAFAQSIVFDSEFMVIVWSVPRDSQAITNHNDHLCPPAVRRDGTRGLHAYVIIHIIVLL